MSNISSPKPLGFVLQQADLISASQIRIALQQQTQSNHLPIGKILAQQGWIKQETANFFVEQWPSLMSHKSQQPLGQYLKQAGLLSENQIRTILLQQKQKKLGLRFGTLAILNQWLKPSTIDFFLKYLTPERTSNWQLNSPLKGSSHYNLSEQLEELRDKLLNNKQCSPFLLLTLYQQILLQGEVIVDYSAEQAELLQLGLVMQEKNKLKLVNNLYQAVFNPCWVDQELAHLDGYSKIKLKLLKLEEKASLPYRLLTEIIAWTGGHPFLLQKFVQILHESELFIPPGKEALEVERLVQEKILHNWKTQPAGTHLNNICHRLLQNEQCEPLHLLALYRKILQKGDVPAQDSSEETELINLGLIIKEDGKLKVANRIYQTVFNLSWLEEELIKMMSSLELTNASILNTNLEKVFLSLPVQEHSQVSQSNQDLEQFSLVVNPQGTKILRTNLPWQLKLSIFGNRWVWLMAGLFSLAGFALTMWLQFKPLKVGQQAAQIEPVPTLSAPLNSLPAVQKLAEEYYLRGGEQTNSKYLDNFANILAKSFTDGQKADAYINRGVIYFREKKYNLAIADYTEAINLNSQQIHAYINRGIAYSLQGNYDLAIKDYQQAILIEPSNVDAYINRGIAYSLQGNYDLAIKDYQQGTLIEPNNPDIYYAWGFTLTQQKGNYLKAIRAYQRAAELYQQQQRMDYFQSANRKIEELEGLLSP